MSFRKSVKAVGASRPKPIGRPVASRQFKKQSVAKIAMIKEVMAVAVPPELADRARALVDSVERSKSAPFLEKFRAPRPS